MSHSPSRNFLPPPPQERKHRSPKKCQASGAHPLLSTRELSDPPSLSRGRASGGGGQRRKPTHAAPAQQRRSGVELRWLHVAKPTKTHPSLGSPRGGGPTAAGGGDQLPSLDLDLEAPRGRQQLPACLPRSLEPRIWWPRRDGPSWGQEHLRGRGERTGRRLRGSERARRGGRASGTVSSGRSGSPWPLRTPSRHPC